MAIEVKLRRGTANQHTTFTGAIGEVTVDISNDTLRVHDGVLAGGHRLAKHSDIGSGGANTGMELTLATPTDGSLTNSAAYQNFTTGTKVTDAIDVVFDVSDTLLPATIVLLLATCKYWLRSAEFALVCNAVLEAKTSRLGLPERSL